MRIRLRLAILAGLVLTGTGTANAGILLGSPLNGTVGSGVASASALTTTPNNYPSATTPNNLTTSVTLSTAASPLDLVIAGTNSGGTTQYTATASLVNSTGAPITSFSFQFGTGTGAGFVQFAPTGISFFATPPTATSPAFPTAVQSAESLTFSGNSLANGGVTSFSFGFAVADVAGTVGTPFTFTLRETPNASFASVPEPSSLVMLAMGGIGLGVATLRKRRRR